jgi:ATP-binding cassette subfamily B protein
MRSESQEAPVRPQLRRVARLFGRYRARMALLLGLVVVQALVGVASPLCLRLLLDEAIPGRDVPLLTALAGGMFVAAVGGGVLSVYTNQQSNVIGQKVMHDLRVGVYDHLQRMSLAFFTRTRSGDTLSRILNDIGGVDSVLTNTATALVQSAVSALALAVVMLLLDWQLALVALVVVPAFLLLTPRLGRRRRAVTRGRQRKMAGLTALITESLSVSGVLLAKTMGSAELRRRFAAESREVSALEMRSAMMGRWALASRRMSLTAVPAIVYWLAGVEFAHGVHPTTIGTVVAFTSMLNRLVSPVSTMQSVGQAVSTSLALFGRVFEVLDLSVEIGDRPGARPLPGAGAVTGTVELRDVWFRYGEDGPWTLRGIDLTVPAGTTTAIVGHTGSGKSTLGYLVARLYEPSRGAVRIDGTDVRDVTLDSLAGAVGLVSQETYLFHDTVAANLRFAKPSATDDELRAACRSAHIDALIDSLPDGYDTVVGERGHRFSGGERQRIAIARVLLRNPPVLILDEATSALDTRTERAVQQALDELSRGRTTIAIAHRLSTIATADQIVVLDAGRIVERGTHTQLLARPTHYAALVEAQTTAVDETAGVGGTAG